VAPLRRELEAEARATIRFETPPGKQLQIDIFSQAGPRCPRRPVDFGWWTSHQGSLAVTN
jgi:hypothetical protein